ncbi:hypothetical protein CBS101457_003878 [Exobasidium rhododendri]|nr:hypothetical protein CBS101457_003878 [Exobasidium rhododendri]
MVRDPYDRLLQGMIPFHNHFRHTHAQIMRAIPTSQAATRSDLQTIFQHSLSLCRSLEMHHSIEEAYIFPLLAIKMPDFGTTNPVHIKEHEAMHVKLEVLEKYSEKTMRALQSKAGKDYEGEGCGKVLKDGGEDGEAQKKPWPTSFYDADKFDVIMRELAAALFPHLDAEEKSLRASNLKEHGFTVQELSRIPM